MSECLLKEAPEETGVSLTAFLAQGDACAAAFTGFALYNQIKFCLHILCAYISERDRKLYVSFLYVVYCIFIGGPIMHFFKVLILWFSSTRAGFHD